MLANPSISRGDGQHRLLLVLSIRDDGDMKLQSMRLLGGTIRSDIQSVSARLGTNEANVVDNLGYSDRDGSIGMNVELLIKRAVRV